MVGEDEMLVGLIPSGIIPPKVVLKNRSSKATRVREFMNQEPVNVSPRADLGIA